MLNVRRSVSLLLAIVAGAATLAAARPRPRAVTTTGTHKEKRYAFVYATGSVGLGASARSQALFTVIFGYCGNSYNDRIEDAIKEEEGRQLAGILRERLGSGANITYLIDHWSTVAYAQQALRRQLDFYGQTLKYQVQENIPYESGIYGNC